MRDIFQATTSGHFRLLFFLACSRIMCHEVIHCIQHLAEQQDSDPVSWSAEHDASYVCHSLVSRLAAPEAPKETLLTWNDVSSGQCRVWAAIASFFVRDWPMKSSILLIISPPGS